MFSTAKDDDMVECPYNKYHQMTRKRLIPHLIKCRLSYPDAELIKCPFNASHLIPEPEFTHHVANCKDKAIIHQYKYNTLPVKIDEDDRQQVEIDCDENWDDTEAADYDPKKYVSQANVIRTHIGNLPSVRKEFRKNERKRLGDEDSSEDEAQKTFGKRIYKDLDCKKKEEIRENNWFEDRGPSSSFASRSQRKDSYKESLKNFSKGRSHDDDEDDDHRKKFIKKEIKEESPDSSSEERRHKEDKSSKRRSVDDESYKESCDRRSKDDYSYERRRGDDNLSKRRYIDGESNTKFHGRHGFLGMSNRARRGRY
ncbi:pre-mRNA-splicing factor 38B-like [Eupeodes corollae]|uniref:pre-mRNA-splicing factor 38B-like n=1 Tax=Eupeodes corollae TaxID=290404 RepID=UPI002490A459|nr:pre-mRNA-splicing factor 38B-like [Eupeodes corollae]